MKFKSKLMLELAILFVLVIVLATVNQTLITRLAAEAQKIIHENNASMNYMQKTLQALDQIQAYHQRQYLNASGSSANDAGRDSEYREALKSFELNLVVEENNITELGEREAVQHLRSSFREYQDAYTTIQTFSRFDAVTYYVDLYPKIENMRTNVYKILNINLEASNFKSNQPHEIANQPIAWLQTIGILSAILALMVWMVAAYALSEKKSG